MLGKTTIVSPRISLLDHKKRFGLLGGLFFLMVLVELLVFNQQYILQRFSNLEQRQLLVDEGVTNQLSNEDGILVSQGIDPNITFEHLDMQIRSVSIACDNSLATASGQIFYRSGDQPFSFLNTYKPSLDGSTTILSFPKTQFVADLRVDLTNRQGDVITCGEFVLNPPPPISPGLDKVHAICMFTLPHPV